MIKSTKNKEAYHCLLVFTLKRSNTRLRQRGQTSSLKGGFRSLGFRHTEDHICLPISGFVGAGHCVFADGGL